MDTIQCDAWFCHKCHGYNKKKIFSANLPSGKIYKSNETCKNCNNTQMVEVRTDYWGAFPNKK